MAEPTRNREAEPHQHVWTVSFPREGEKLYQCPFCGEENLYRRSEHDPTGYDLVRGTVGKKES
jgi:hypothetical protein